ncbi:MAG: hypothetical protein DBY04_02010 [Clostridiales bacterium]|nr:MAG: hypothetical protein DBY04_02010 [Clostridiales bacterium]
MASVFVKYNVILTTPYSFSSFLLYVFPAELSINNLLFLRKFYILYKCKKTEKTTTICIMCLF